MGFREQLSEARLFPGWLIQSLHKSSPLLVIENEMRLIRESLFRFFARGAEDKVGDFDPLPASRHFDETLLTGSGAKLEAPVSWLFECRDRHNGEPFQLYFQCTPRVKLSPNQRPTRQP